MTRDSEACHPGESAVPSVRRERAPRTREMAAMSMNPAARVVTLAVAVMGATAVAVGIRRGGVVIVVAVFVVGLVLTRRRSLAAVTGDRARLGQALTQAWWAPVAAVLGVALVA